MSNYELTYKQYGEKGILISWPQLIDNSILEDIVRVKNAILLIEENELLDVTNGYNSILFLYEKVLDFPFKVAHLKKIISSRKDELVSVVNTVWKIPVCYHESFGLDLKDLAVAKNKTLKQIINLHTAPNYKVFCKGFLPGFMYLGGLDSTLHMPRKASPRLKIPKNSVAIGGKQTGIYPCESPGGWHIIGRTPITLFDVNSKEGSPVQLGDTIIFQEISLTDYIAMESQNIKLISGFG